MTWEEAAKDMEARGIIYLGLVAFDPVTDGLSFYFKDDLPPERGSALLRKAIPGAELKVRKA